MRHEPSWPLQSPVQKRRIVEGLYTIAVAGQDQRVRSLIPDGHGKHPIEPGEEIFVNYNGEPDDKDELWFDVVEAGAD